MKRTRRAAVGAAIAMITTMVPATPASAATASVAPAPGPYPAHTARAVSCTDESPSTTTCAAGAVATPDGLLDLTVDVSKGIKPDGHVRAEAMGVFELTATLPRPTRSYSYYADVELVEVESSALSGVTRLDTVRDLWWQSQPIELRPGTISLPLQSHAIELSSPHWIPARSQTFFVGLRAIAEVEGDIDAYEPTRCSLFSNWMIDGRLPNGQVPCDDTSTPNRIYVGDASLRIKARVTGVRVVYDDAEVFDHDMVTASSSDDDLTLRWPPAHGVPTEVTGYRVDYSGEGQPVKTVTVDATTLSFELRDKPLGSRWHFAVAPMAGAVVGAKQWAVARVAPRAPTVAVTNVRQNGFGPCLTWDKPATETRIEEVALVRSSATEAPRRVQPPTSSQSSSWCDDPPKGATYTYSLVGLNPGGQGPLSNSVTIRVD